MSWSRLMWCSLVLAAVAVASPISAQTDRYSSNIVRIGVLNDRSGPLSDATGEGFVVEARLAVEEFGGKVNGLPVEIVSADHQNKPDVGSTIARQWYDRDNVDVIVDVANSAVSLDLRRFVEQHGGKILGEVRHPIGTADFTSFLLQAQASGAEVIALANSASGLSNSIKQAPRPPWPISNAVSIGCCVTRSKGRSRSRALGG